MLEQIHPVDSVYHLSNMGQTSPIWTKALKDSIHHRWPTAKINNNNQILKRKTGSLLKIRQQRNQIWQIPKNQPNLPRLQWLFRELSHQTYPLTIYFNIYEFRKLWKLKKKGVTDSCISILKISYSFAQVDTSKSNAQTNK